MLTIFDPSKLAKSRAVLDGAVSTESLPRLSAEIDGKHSEISYSLQFDYDAHGVCFIEGDLSCVLQLTCYRCLQACEESLHLKFALSPIDSLDKTTVLPEIYEPIITTDGTIDLLVLLEEEILLALPLVPKHVAGDPQCIQSELFVPEGESERIANANSVVNPFKDLKNLTTGS